MVVEDQGNGWRLEGGGWRVEVGGGWGFDLFDQRRGSDVVTSWRRERRGLWCEGEMDASASIRSVS